MKKLGLIILTTGFVGALALAQNPTTSAKKDYPCKNIRTACEAAGFHKKGHKEGKGLWKDCFSKILAGETVAGVTVNSADVSACKAIKEKKKAK